MANQSLVKRFSVAVKTVFGKADAYPPEWMWGLFGTGDAAGTPYNTKEYKDFVKAGYKNLIWVYRCINKKAEAIASIPWLVYKVGKDGKRTRLHNHPLETLLNAPNPFLTRFEFFQWWMIYLDLAGSSYWEIVTPTTGAGEQSKRLPVALFPLRPDQVRPIPDPNRYIKGYELLVNGQWLNTYKPEEIVWYRYLDPENEYHGLSPIRAGARTVDTENSAIDWNKSVFDNSAIPGGVLEIEGDLSPEQRQDIEHQLKTKYSGGNRHKSMILTGGMKWVQNAMKHMEMDFTNQRRFNRIDICGMAGVPPEIVGAVENPTYTNYDIARTSFWEDTITPITEFVAGRINAQLCPIYGENIVVRPDFSKVPALFNSFAKKVITGKTLFSMGWGINAINARLDLDLPEVPWGDTGWIPMNMMPVTEEHPEGPEDTPTSLSDQPPASNATRLPSSRIQ